LLIAINHTAILIRPCNGLELQRTNTLKDLELTSISMPIIGLVFGLDGVVGLMAITTILQIL